MRQASNSASPSGPPAPLERADAPWEPNFAKGFFRYARMHFGGLSLAFWVLMIYLFLALSFLDEHIKTLEAIRPRSFLGLFALLVALGKGIREELEAGRPLAIRRSQTFWLAAFLVSTIFSTLFAFDFAEAKQPFLDHATAILSYFLLVNIVRTRREFLLTLLVMCAGVGTFLLLSLHEWRGGRMDYAQGVVRMMGVGWSNADPNSFGATVVFTLPLVVWAGTHSRSWFVWLCALVYSAAACYAVLMSSSRSALVLTVLTALFTIVLLRRGWPRVVAGGAVVLAAVAMLTLLSGAQKERIESIWSGATYTRESSTVDRIEGYRVGFRILAENPVLGVGPGNWSAYRVRGVGGDGRALMPHNLTGELVATGGSLGTFTFVAFLFVSVAFGLREFFRRRRAPTRWDRAVGALCLTCVFILFLLLVSGLGAHNLTRANWSYVPALMLIAATCRNEDWDIMRETAT